MVLREVANRNYFGNSQQLNDLLKSRLSLSNELAPLLTLVLLPGFLLMILQACKLDPYVIWNIKF